MPAELWRDVLCVQEERQVGNDNCVRWQGRVLQIPPSPLRPHFVRGTVRVHDYPDGTVAIFKGPHRLASFPPAAEPRAGHGRVTTATRPGRWICGQRSALPTTPPAHNSGQLMRYLWRTRSTRSLHPKEEQERQAREAEQLALVRRTQAELKSKWHVRSELSSLRQRIRPVGVAVAKMEIRALRS